MTMPDDLVERSSDALIEFLHDACIAGCSCLTKSPEIVFHESTCHYRLHVQSIDRITALTARLAELERATPEEVVEMAARALRDTPLLVPGTLFDLLCTTTYANDHIIALLLSDAAANAVAAIAPMLRRQGAAVERERCAQLAGWRSPAIGMGVRTSQHASARRVRG